MRTGTTEEGARVQGTVPSSFTLTAETNEQLRENGKKKKTARDRDPEETARGWDPRTLERKEHCQLQAVTCESDAKQDKDTMSAMVKLAKEIEEPYDIDQPTEECHLMEWLHERRRVTQRCDLRLAQGGEEDTEERDMMLHTEMCGKSEGGRRRRGTRTPAASPTPKPTWSPSEDSAASETCGTSETEGSLFCA